MVWSYTARDAAETKHQMLKRFNNTLSSQNETAVLPVSTVLTRFTVCTQLTKFDQFNDIIDNMVLISVIDATHTRRRLVKANVMWTRTRPKSADNRIIQVHSREQKKLSVEILLFTA